MRHLLTSLAGPLAGAVALLCTPIAALAVDTRTGPRVDGAELFNRSCGNSHCHGTNGTGAGGPALRGRSLTPERIADVLAKGIPGTRMRAFAQELSPAEISLLVSFITGRPPAAATAGTAATPTGAATPVSLRPADRQRDEARQAAERRGERLFFDTARDHRCAACHTYFGRGGASAADLTVAAGWTSKQLSEAITNPAPAKDGKSRAVRLTLRDGSSASGLLQSASPGVVQIADVSDFPVVQRWFATSVLAEQQALAPSALPVHGRPPLSGGELGDVVAYLQSHDLAGTKPVRKAQTGASAPGGQ
ncbi:MAG TPA: c-type cytochrome [Burkholderiaceae bacterium]|nr:c-type cytochrome [Burkholderiaceae bacterium]